MEMMLVLAVLVGVAAMVWPALQGPLDDQRLLKSAELIRAQWTKARVTAMKNGRLYVFRYVTASDEYSVEPWSGEGDTVEASNTATTDQSAALPRATDEKRHPLGVAGQRLPEGIQFYSGETQMDARSAEVTAEGSTASSSAGLPPPIVFYPDGSTSDARLLLTNERCFVQVTLRGLTGLVRVSELLSSEELSTSGGFVQ
jgi:Tfp pilus assembly protein FimT